MEFSEVSIVAKPAYTDTDISVAVRSLNAFMRDRNGISLDLARKLHQTRLA